MGRSWGKTFAILVEEFCSAAACHVRGNEGVGQAAPVVGVKLVQMLQIDACLCVCERGLDIQLCTGERGRERE